MINSGTPPYPGGKLFMLRDSRFSHLLIPAGDGFFQDITCVLISLGKFQTQKSTLCS